MAELADAQVSKTCGSDPIVWVRFPPAAQIGCWQMKLGAGGSMVERCIRIAEVGSSTLLRSTGLVNF